MKVTIDIREDWILDVMKETGADGSNDAEHDLLMEVADEVRPIVIERLRDVNQKVPVL